MRIEMNVDDNLTLEEFINLFSYGWGGNDMLSLALVNIVKRKLIEFEDSFNLIKDKDVKANVKRNFYVLFGELKK